MATLQGERNWAFSTLETYIGKYGTPANLDKM